MGRIRNALSLKPPLREALSLTPSFREAMSFAPYSRASTTALAVAELAARQWGVVSRAQLIACGVSGSVISRWVRDGRLFRLYPGVYAVGHTNLPYQGRLVAALFAMGSGAGLADATGMHWWQLIEEAPREIHVGVPGRRRPAGPDIRVHHPRQLSLVRHRRLPVTPVPETLVAFAANAPLREVRKALSQADFHKRFDPDAIRTACGQGRPGTTNLMTALESHLPQLAFAASDLEVEFLFLCEKFELPIPRVNVWIGSKKVDALWPELNLVVELDGRSAHGSPARTLADHQRDLELRSLGYRVLRYSWHQVFHHPWEVANDLRAAIAAAGG